MGEEKVIDPVESIGQINEALQAGHLVEVVSEIDPGNGSVAKWSVVKEGDEIGDLDQYRITIKEKVVEPAPAATTETEKNLPWVVAIATKSENGSDVFTVHADGFQLQVQADAWIKENAEEGPVYASVRKGKMFQAKVVRKLQEI